MKRNTVFWLIFSLVALGVVIALLSYTIENDSRIDDVASDVASLQAN